jgi:hypothetical protein
MINAYFLLKNSQKKNENNRMINNKGKRSPSQEINHHVTGLREGARQASK